MTDRPDRRTGRSGSAGSAPRCPHCDTALQPRHCKFVCPNHGVVIDCSDPFR